jgi:hypothetical protein
MNTEQVFYGSKGANMSKSTRNSGKPWSLDDVKSLKQLAKGNTPTGVMSIQLGRTEDAIRAKASELGVSLKPTNQSPYNRRKK